MSQSKDPSSLKRFSKKKSILYKNVSKESVTKFLDIPSKSSSKPISNQKNSVDVKLAPPSVSELSYS